MDEINPSSSPRRNYRLAEINQSALFSCPFSFLFQFQVLLGLPTKLCENPADCGNLVFESRFPLERAFKVKTKPQVQVGLG